MKKKYPERYNIVSFATLFEYPLAKKIAPLFNKLGMTPNMITTMNIFFRFYIIYTFVVEKRVDIYLLLMLIVSQFLDVLDGTVARMYDMVTDFGDKLDHISDTIFFCIIIGNVLYQHYKFHIFAVLIAVLLVVLIYNMQNIPFLKKFGYIEDVLGANSTLIIIIIYIYGQYWR